ncbi:hypothetical protein COF63_29485, partial [Bacillus pseudomycoides]|uniref:hypothetical protein n=1 Tax=Bacillus pseudomycoides TaxID=64104 RepID=UPI000BFB4FF9
NVLLSVAKTRRIPTLTRDPPFFVLWIYAFFIHSYPGVVLGFSFVTGLAEKLYKILHVLSVVVFRNAGGTPISL